MDELGFKSVGIDYLLRKTNLKRDLLYFDKIIFDTTELKMANTLVAPIAKIIHGQESTEIIKFQNAELDYLKEKDLLIEFDSKLLEKKAYERNLTDFTKFFEEHKKKKMLFSHNEVINMGSVFNELDNFITGQNKKPLSIYRTYFICALLNATTDLQSIPILDDFIPETKENQGKEYKIAEMVINKFPVIDDLVSWEQLSDFKQDPESKRKFMALRNWIIDISKGTLTAREVGEKLDFLLSEYTFHLDKHKIKTSFGALKSFTITTAEILENTLKLNWSKVAETFFEVFEHSSKLAEIESNLPGREVGYIYHIKDKLGKNADR